MSEFKVNTITNKDGSYGPQVCGITTFGGSGIQLPSGPTEMRGGRGRGVIHGGRDNPTYYADMDFIEIATTGNTSEFGNLRSKGQSAYGGTASSTRGLVCGGYESPAAATVSAIQYYTFSSGGGANDFGDLIAANNQASGASNNRLAVLAGEYPTYRQGALQYITIATTGDATDFGSLVGNDIGSGGISSPTRGIMHGVDRSGPTLKMTQSFEIATTGNSEEFGELFQGYKAQGGASSSTRGLSMAGYINSSTQSTGIDFCTIATKGNFEDFGDLTTARHSASGTSNSVRAVLGGGATGSSGSNTNVMDFVTISTTGNATDFGDMTYASGGARGTGFSGDAHGGLAQ